MPACHHMIRFVLVERSEMAVKMKNVKIYFDEYIRKESYFLFPKEPNYFNSWTRPANQNAPVKSIQSTTF